MANMPIKFDLKCVQNDLDDIIPVRKDPFNPENALKEMEPAVRQLSEDISGVGPKAAERYLLQYEYRMGTKEIADRFGVSQSTVSNQISSVRSMVLKYPRLARVIGTFRAHRAEISLPDITDGKRWEGDTELEGETIDYRVVYTKGNAGRSYSWSYACASRYEGDNGWIHHLFADYMIDSVHGVFLARTMRGVSHRSWNRPPISSSYDYTVYPLPNAAVLNERNGTLIDAVEYHLTYDTKNHFESLITGENVGGDVIQELDGELPLLERAKDGEEPSKGSGYWGRYDVLCNHVRNHQRTNECIKNHSDVRHIRVNLERLMRLYPFEAPLDLPAETVTQLWNGQPSERAKHYLTSAIDKRALWQVSHTANSSTRAGDIYRRRRGYSIDMPVW